VSYYDAIVPTVPLPKVIAACLDLMPHARTWDEYEFAEFMEMFEGACRVWYRLPSSRSKHAVSARRAAIGAQIGTKPASPPSP
jgi:hypothetical protein